MISCRWKGPCELEIEGHAGYGEEGEDIVCAGASTLWGTLNREMDRRETLGQGVHEIEGNAVRFRAFDSEIEAEIRGIFEMIWGGYLLLSEKYENWIEARRTW